MVWVESPSISSFNPATHKRREVSRQGTHQWWEGRRDAGGSGGWRHGSNRPEPLTQICTPLHIQVLTSADVASREYVALAFSEDGKLLAAQGGAPDWALLLWGWDRSKLLCVARPSGPGAGPRAVVQLLVHSRACCVCSTACVFVWCGERWGAWWCSCWCTCVDMLHSAWICYILSNHRRAGLGSFAQFLFHSSPKNLYTLSPINAAPSGGAGELVSVVGAGGLLRLYRNVTGGVGGTAGSVAAGDGLRGVASAFSKWEGGSGYCCHGWAAEGERLVSVG